MPPPQSAAATPSSVSLHGETAPAGLLVRVEREVLRTCHRAGGGHAGAVWLRLLRRWAGGCRRRRLEDCAPERRLPPAPQSRPYNSLPQRRESEAWEGRAREGWLPWVLQWRTPGLARGWHRSADFTPLCLTKARVAHSLEAAPAMQTWQRRPAQRQRRRRRRPQSLAASVGLGPA